MLSLSDSLLFFFVLVLTVAAGILCYFRHRVESVLLPCRTKVHLPGNGKVEWRDGDNDVVHVYQKGSDQHGEQGQYYRNRTKMNEDPLNTGNLSLTLRYPEVSDGYTCRVYIYSRDGEILMEKQVELRFRCQQVEVEEGAESVLLPFEETLELLAGDKVEWRLCDVQNAVSNKLEPIIIFVSLPQGPQWTSLAPDLKRVNGESVHVLVCVSWPMRGCW
uniref:Ig-like domain-containing protein n=1 Tax=Poecilia reticulata TaxID=8081 RepID=A0A3P9Q0M8_POERE